MTTVNIEFTNLPSLAEVVTNVTMTNDNAMIIKKMLQTYGLHADDFKPVIIKSAIPYYRQFEKRKKS